MRDEVLFAWADSRPHVGVGHVVRSFALAQAWADQGGRAVLCTDGLGGAIRALTEDPLVERLEIAEAETPLDGVGAKAFAELALDAGATWVSLDSYAIGAEAQSTLRAAGLRVAVVDDHLATAPYDADLLVDQNLGAERRSVAAPGRVRHLALGVEHALLRRGFREAARTPGPRAGGRVVVLLGGNPAREVVAWGAAVATTLAAETPVDLVLGGAALDQALPEAVVVHHVLHDTSALLSGATVAVSAAGSTAWELCATGVPSVLVAVAGNQIEVGDELAAAGAAHFAGPIAPTAGSAPESIATRVRHLLRDADLRAEMTERGRALVDGQGAVRVVAAMRACDLRLRRTGDGDIERYFAWANDPAVRAASFSTAPIGWDEHVRWFTARLASPTSWLYVAEDRDGTPVGQIRFEATDGVVDVGVSVDPAARGQRLAAPLIVAGVRAVRDDAPRARCIRAEVRASNEASARAFATAGFRRRDRVHDDRDPDGVDVFVRDPRRCT